MENKQNIPALLRPLNKQKKPKNPKPVLTANEIQVLIQNNKAMLDYLASEAQIIRAEINFFWDNSDPENPSKEFLDEGTYFNLLNKAKDSLRANRKKYLTLAAIQSKLKKIL